MFRIVFLGTPEFAVPSLRALAGAGYPVAAVVTQPDRPRGRGQAPAPPAVKRAAQTLDLPVLQPERVNDADVVERLRAWRPDVLVVVAYGQILRPALLALPARGCLNVHASLLPKYRGAAPVQWALAEGDAETGVTVQFMAERVDSGNIVEQARTPIASGETAPELAARLAALGAEALLAALRRLEQEPDFKGEPQDEAKATFAPRLRREDARLDWSWSAQRLAGRVRGFQPWPGTRMLLHGQTMKITAARPVAGPMPAGIEPGRIAAIDEANGWLVAVGEGALWIEQVQAAGGAVMSAADFARGHEVRVGDRLE